jgi:meromycolic acid (3R)-3-hydroxyacyl-[acyl-carrier protein] dehydratase HadB
MKAPAVGDTIPPLVVEVTHDQIRAYADASGDDNPVHSDEAAAKAAGLPGIIAHGMLTMSLLGRALMTWTGDPDRVRLFGVRFTGIVRPGDRLTAQGRVVSVDDAAHTAELELWVDNQRGEAVISKGRGVVELRPYARAA